MYRKLISVEVVVFGIYYCSTDQIAISAEVQGVLAAKGEGTLLEHMPFAALSLFFPCEELIPVLFARLRHSHLAFVALV